MDRRNFLSKLHLPLVAAACIPLAELAEAKPQPKVMFPVSPQCVQCGRIFDMSQRPKEGLGWKPGTEEAVIFHDRFAPEFNFHCPNEGKRFRVNLTKHTVEEL
jgi:hypothetical protein